MASSIPIWQQYKRDAESWKHHSSQSTQNQNSIPSLHKIVRARTGTLVSSEKCTVVLKCEEFSRTTSQLLPRPLKTSHRISPYQYGGQQISLGTIVFGTIEQRHDTIFSDRDWTSNFIFHRLGNHQNGCSVYVPEIIEKNVWFHHITLITMRCT